MKTSHSLFFLSFLSTLTYSNAIRLPAKARRSPGSSQSKLKLKQLNASPGNASDDLSNIGNIRYTTNITINGVEVHVALDTGSTDLWVQPPGGIGKFNDTKIPISLLYGDGTYGINGTVGVAPFEFGPYKVERQAFVNAVTGNIGGIQDLGIYGLLGLGFDDPNGSPIISTLQDAYGPSATWGASVLNNTFSQNSSQPNFIAFDLSRTDDLESSGDGSFTIGEYDPDFLAIKETPKLPKYPPPPVGYRWSVQFDNIQVNGKSLMVSSGVKGVSKGKGVALLDTGNPSGSLPSDLLDAIYSTIDGAVKFADQGQWIVPCLSESLPLLTFDFGGQTIPIHPLDMSDIQESTVQGKGYTYCVSSFTADDTITVTEFDIALGDTFLRNVYSLYDFGDTLPDGTTSDAYVQLLAKTNVSESTVTDYIASRKNSMKSHSAPEIAPKALLKLFQEDTSADSVDIAGGSGTSLTDNSGSDSSLISKYGPAIIGLLAANIVIGLVLVVLGVLQYVRKGASSSLGTRSSHYVPVRTKIDDGNNVGQYERPYSE